MARKSDQPRLKAGIIGLGVGEQHIAGYRRHPACEVALVCDLSPEKLAEIARKHPEIKQTADAGEVLENPEINVVSIASYDQHHYEQIVRGLEHNKHLFVEKPFCLFQEQAAHIKDLLRAKPELKISSNLILRQSPRFQAVRDLMAQGALGDLFYVEGDYNYGRLEKITEGWRGRLDFYSVVHGGAIHLIDLLLWLTGEEVVEVTAYGNNIASRGSGFAHHDLVACLMKGKSGVVGKVTANFGCVYPHFHHLALYGVRGTFVNTAEAGLYYHGDRSRPQVQQITAPYPGVHKGALIHSFVASILNGREALVTAADIFRTLSVCFAVEAASRQSGPVAVQYL